MEYQGVNISREYRVDVVYARHEKVYVPNKRSYAISLEDDNHNNDPEDDDGTNWVRLWNPMNEGMAVWWGLGQTERLPTTELIPAQAVNSDGVKSFTGSTPNQTEGDDLGITCVNLNTIANADSIVSAPNAALTIPAGLYDIEGRFYGNQTPDDNVHLRVMIATTGADDIEVFSGTPRQKNYFGIGVNMIHAEYDFSETGRRFSSEATLYIDLVDYDDDATPQDRLVGYLAFKREN